MSIGSKKRRDQKRKKRARLDARSASAESARITKAPALPPHQWKHVQNFTSARAEAPSALTQRLRAVVADLENHGIVVNPSGRIFQYIRDLEQSESRTTHEQAPAEIERFAATWMDGSLLADTFEALRAPPEVAHWRTPHFELALKGGAVPGGKDDRPWAKILELYVAAVAKNKGYEVELAEPDVVIKDGPAKYGCAAKRPRSARKLQERIEEGVTQIAGQNLDGFLVVDLTLVLGLHESPFTIENLSEGENISRILYARVKELFANGEVDRWVRNHPSGHRVFGVAAMAFATAYVRATRECIAVRRWIADGIRTQQNDAQVAFFYEFTTRRQ